MTKYKDLKSHKLKGETSLRRAGVIQEPKALWSKRELGIFIILVIMMIIYLYFLYNL